MPRQIIIEIKDGQTGNPAVRMARPLSLTVCDGEQVAVVGDNAAGKTRLVETLSGILPVQGTALKFDFSPSPLRLVSENIKYIAFRDTYDGADDNYYMQKRWNQQDIDDDTPTAGALLERAFNAAETGSGRFLDEAARDRLHEERIRLRDRLYDMFGLEGLLDSYIISLSSGELRKFQLTRTLLYMPRVLVLDNPFIGLDSDTRAQLADLLGALVRNMHLLVILVLARMDLMPSFITHVIPVEGLEVLPKMPVADFLAKYAVCNPESTGGQRRSTLHDEILSIPVKDLLSEHFYPKDPSPEIVRCTDVTIRYGSRTILQDLNWTVREGERWALTGQNGSGKSTLLSLICADNPQGYACNIELFGKKRGTGESIWDIKRYIGYVSPEMHRAYLKNLPALDIVASGLFDTVGLFMHPTAEQLEVCRLWMDVFGIAGLADRPYLRLSSGEQRLCLLARAFVKDPELLILDEPMHGLDAGRCGRVKEVIDTFVQRPHKTLIMVSHYESELPSCIDHRLILTRPS